MSATATRETPCRICSRTLPRKPTAGRPFEYCSEGCRREAEYTLKRLGRRLQVLEDKQSDARIEAQLHGGDEYKLEIVAAIEAEKVRLTARMRALIA